MMADVAPRSRWKVRLLGALLVVLVVGGSAAYLGWRQAAPPVRAAVIPPPRFIGLSTTFTVVLEAARGRIAQAEVRIAQGRGGAVVLTQPTLAGSRLETPVTIQGATLGLREGAATLEVWARDDYWRPLRRTDAPAASIPVTIDLTPPSIDVLAATQYVSQGGGGIVVFRLRGGDAAEVRAGPLAFPSFPAGDGGVRVALIGLPWDFRPGTALTVAAHDEAGNAATRGVPTEIRTRHFRSDRIRLAESFLETKVPELLPQRPPTQPLLDGFLLINRDLRRQAEEEKRRAALRTAPHALWEGAFVQPRNTKVFSNFAETRTYLYGGREVDRQVHLGYDLASFRQSPVPAANKGVVVFAGPLTIYGNAVIVDHGLGLQTLYGHLSSAGVKAGDPVEKGQELGRTGSTGLAMGDHLHFEVLVDGVSITPVEWWDAKWIRDHIDRPLEQAGLPALGGAAQRAAAAKRTLAADPGRHPRAARR
jgi:murein DD-endopeptidase MepM/ murein hydrolase activator NlpD